MKLLHIKKLVLGGLISTLILSPVYSQAAIVKLGSKNSEVKTIQTMLKDMGYYKNSKITGYYGSITESAVKKFQKDNGLAADGVVGKDTRNAFGLLGSTANFSSENETSDLDWFQEVRYLWKRGEDAVITDVDTGLSFTVRRTFGTNHADVEPLTINDTKIIKEIWGGFTWERRAVVVEVNGYRIAASMTSMPHAGLDSKPSGSYVRNRSCNYGTGYNLDAVKKNGADGVMDIHFKNSRTHSTNTKQSSHQNMIKKAKQYIGSLS